MTTLTIRRPVAASDAYDVELTDGIYLLWAYGAGPGDATRRRAISYGQHLVSGVVVANIITGGLSAAATPAPAGLTPAELVLIMVGAVGVLAALVRLVRFASRSVTNDAKARGANAGDGADANEMMVVASARSGASATTSTGAAPGLARSASGSALSRSASFVADASGGSGVAPAPSRRRPSPLLRVLAARVAGSDITGADLGLILLYVVINIIAFFVGYAPNIAQKFGTPVRPGRSEGKGMDVTQGRGKGIDVKGAGQGHEKCKG